MVQNLYAALPEIILALGSCFALMFGVFSKNASTAAINTPRLSVIIILASLASLAFTPIGGGLFFNKLFVVDNFSTLTKAIILFSGAIILTLSYRYLDDSENAVGFEYSIVVLLSLLGMLVMVSANDLLTLYMGLELQSLSLYIMAASKRNDKRSSEAAIKYFILGALASGILLYGISLIYGFMGTTSLSQISNVLSATNTAPTAAVVGLVLLTIGLCFKISAAPFHMWSPDVYEGVPTPVTAYFAIVPKLAAMALFVRIFSNSFHAIADQWQQVLIITSILSMLVGAFGGLRQTNIKRLLAYSSIGHMGYILMGICAANAQGVQAILTYFFIYILNSVAIFAVIMAIRTRENNTESDIETIDHFKGLAKTNPILAMMFALMMVSMIGLPFPPFAGFFGKFFVFGAAVKADLYYLAVIGVLSSVVAAYYYLRIIKLMYIDKPLENIRVTVNLDSRTIFIITICALVSLAIFLYPSLILDVSLLAASK